jgi:hypothetical protein
MGRGLLYYGSGGRSGDWIAWLRTNGRNCVRLRPLRVWGLVAPSLRSRRRAARRHYTAASNKLKQVPARIWTSIVIRQFFLQKSCRDALLILSCWSMTSFFARAPCVNVGNWRFCSRKIPKATSKRVCAINLHGRLIFCLVMACALFSRLHILCRN